MPKGILIFFSSCMDPARHREHNAWYSRIHLPDLSAAHGLVRARRFTNSRPDSRAGQYLAVYDFESDDLEASVADLRRIALETRRQGRHIDCLGSGARGIYREIDPAEFNPLERVSYPVPSWPSPTAPDLAQPLLATTLPRALRLVMTDCTDPAREEEFNRWYSHTHLPDLRPARGLVGATRYRNEHPEQGQSAYLAVYEFQDDDLEASQLDFLRLAGESREHGRHIDCIGGIGTHFFLEVDASAYEPPKTLDYPRVLTSQRLKEAP